MRRLPRSFDYDLARVLLVDDDPASRITLKTVLEASGYHVDSAASAAEAVGKLEDGTYELVLSELDLISRCGLEVLAQARNMDYKPATALLKTYQNSKTLSTSRLSSILIKPEDIPGLLSKVAALSVSEPLAAWSANFVWLASKPPSSAHLLFLFHLRVRYFHEQCDGVHLANGFGSPHFRRPGAAAVSLVGIDFFGLCAF